MRTLKFAEALAEAIAEAMDANDRVILIGGNPGGLTGGAFFNSVMEKNAARIKYPPISEIGFTGIAVGAAMSGMRPLVNYGTASFSYEALPQIVNEAAIASSNSAGQVTVPVVFYMLYGLRGAGAVQHSGSPQAWYWNTPGLQVAMPGTPADVKGLMRWALLKSKNPTVFMNHGRLMDNEGEVPDGTLDIPFGQAEVKRQGSDVTIVACGVQVPRALEAADKLAGEGIQAEIVDPRTLEPLDRRTILTSIAKTGRVVVTDESHDDCGVAAGLAAIIADEGFRSLKAPVKRVSTMPVPVPYAKTMEDYVMPSSERIVAAAREITKG